jgi:hypothetical protein
MDGSPEKPGVRFLNSQEHYTIKGPEGLQDVRLFSRLSVLLNLWYDSLNVISNISSQRNGMEIDWAWQLGQFEATQVRYSDDPLPGQAAFRYQPGVRPVLISAPHGACHWREDRWKYQDGYTSALAYVLAKYTGAHALYTVRRIRPDPNFEDDCDYKHTLADLLRNHPIRLVLDLHGARSDREFAVAVGTIDSSSCPDYEGVIVRAFIEQEFGPNYPHFLDRLVLNPLNYRGGARQRTVTRFAWEQCRVNAAQLELNASLRVVSKSPAHPATFTPDPLRQRRAINALINVILAVH